MCRLSTVSPQVSKEALFLISKSAEALVVLLSEQSATSARRAKRKSVSTNELASVLDTARRTRTPPHACMHAHGHPAETPP